MAEMRPGRGQITQGPGVLGAAKSFKSLRLLCISVADALMADFFFFFNYSCVLLVSRLTERHAAKIQGGKNSTTKTKSYAQEKICFFFVLIYLSGTTR